MLLRDLGDFFFSACCPIWKPALALTGPLQELRTLHSTAGGVCSPGQLK